MGLPFTKDEFIEVFRKYNLAVFPMQLLLYLFALATIYLLIHPGSKSSKTINAVLSFLWIWMGVVYHLVYFSSINKAAILFGSLFVFEGLLFLYFGVLRNRISFEFHKDIFGSTGIGLILLALIIYPVLGIILGHTYPFAPGFGLPCPTTIFTFGFLLQIRGKSPLFMYVIPLVWSVIGFTAAFNLGIKEDTVLLFSGLVTFAMLLYKKARWKTLAGKHV